MCLADKRAIFILYIIFKIFSFFYNLTTYSFDDLFFCVSFDILTFYFLSFLFFIVNYLIFFLFFKTFSFSPTLSFCTPLKFKCYPIFKIMYEHCFSLNQLRVEIFSKTKFFMFKAQRGCLRITPSLDRIYGQIVFLSINKKCLDHIHKVIARILRNFHT